VILPSDPLERVRVGMPVVDRAGARLGQVARVQMAATRVTHPPDSDILDEMSSVVPAPPDMSDASAQMEIIGPSPVGHDPADLPDVPEPVRAHLEQVGFIEINKGSDLAEVDRFVAADHIDEVAEDRVVIRAARADQR
jgi:hypothetical protein